MMAQLERLIRARSVRSALRLVEDRADVLLVLPSTRSALHLAREFCALHGGRVIAVPVPEQRTWVPENVLCTPAQVVAGLAGHSALPGPVISFPDALIGEGDAFAVLPFLGIDRSFSILEALLVMRHRPAVYGLRSGALRGSFRLVRIPYEDLLGGMQGVALVPLMRRLLSELEGELAHPPRDWLAARCFELKSPAVFEQRVREELREVESLLRLAVIASGSRPDSLEALAPALEGVTRQLRGGPRHRPTLH